MWPTQHGRQAFFFLVWFCVVVAHTLWLFGQTHSTKHYPNPDDHNLNAMYARSPLGITCVWIVFFVWQKRAHNSTRPCECVATYLNRSRNCFQLKPIRHAIRNLFIAKNNTHKNHVHTRGPNEPFVATTVDDKGHWERYGRAKTQMKMTLFYFLSVSLSLYLFVASAHYEILLTLLIF